MLAQLDEATAQYRMAHKFDVLDVRALNSCQRVYVAALPKSQATVARWVAACGCESARYGWDGVGGLYVDVRGGV